MKKIYKANILYTKDPSRFEVIENGFLAVGDDGRIIGVTTDLASLDSEEAEIVDFGNRLLIPAMNDMHVHAPQLRNQAVAMDLELLPWLQNYTFPEEVKYADIHYAEKMYRRFLHTQWLFGSMRSCVYSTVHTESTRLLMKLYQETGMGAFVGKVAMNRNCPEALCEDVEAASIIMISSSSPWQRPSGLPPSRQEASLARWAVSNRAMNSMHWSSTTVCSISTTTLC